MNNNSVRVGSILLAITLSTLILLFPQGVTDDAQQAQHGLLTLYMLAVMIGFIYGVGFSF
jgi:predicted membrane protein